MGQELRERLEDQVFNRCNPFPCPVSRTSCDELEGINRGDVTGL